MFNMQFSGLSLFKRGRVQDVYSMGDKLLMLASDRVCCFGVILPTSIPGKGKLLTAMSAHWFSVMADLAPNHLLARKTDDYPAVCHDDREQWEGRSLWVKHATPAPFACVVRGYLFGSAWKEYRERGRVYGIRLPKGLVEAARLVEPVFIACMKTASGESGEEITFAEMAARIGMTRAKKMREVSIAVYLRARDLAQARGIIIAETKLQFGFADDETILTDELLTADSSRFWLAEDYQPGKTPESCDTDYLRDYLNSVNWDRRPPVPTLPPEIIGNMQKKYQEVLRRLTESPTACLGFDESRTDGVIPGQAKPAIANEANQIPRQI